jgi:hypothetical protein
MNPFVMFWVMIKMLPSSRRQSKFFETFAAPFTKRGLLLKFLLLGGGSLLAYVSASASPDLLPIKKGPGAAAARPARCVWLRDSQDRDVTRRPLLSLQF